MARPREGAVHRARRRRATLEVSGRLGAAAGGERCELEDELVRLNLVVAHDVARRYYGRGLATDDLDQVACLGLVKAARGFDPLRGTTFLAYAVPTIRGELRRHFRDHGWVVRPPRSVQELQPRVLDARGRLWQRLGRDPRVGEVAEELQVEASAVCDAMAVEGCFTPSSLDLVPREGAGPADRLATGDPGFAHVDAVETLRPLLVGLSDRERTLLSMRFVEGCTQAEIGRELGVTQMQVSRLLSGLLSRLRVSCGGIRPERTPAARPAPTPSGSVPNRRPLVG